MKYHEIINEMIWDDASSAAQAAKKYPNAWIHFSKMPKLGVNPRVAVEPSKYHHDPPGIYFYPIRWLLSDQSSSSQYGTSMPYYFIVNVKPNARIINLGNMKMSTVVNIATANGWINDLKEVQAKPELLDNKNQPMARKNLKKPGGIFYATMDYLANIKGRPWLPMVKGYAGLFDPGYGIVSPNETAQMVVFGRQYISVIEQGENKDNTYKEYANILKQIAAELNGKFYYIHQVPTADFIIDGKSIQIQLSFKMMTYIIQSYYDNGFWISKKNKYDTFNGDKESHYSSIKYYVMDAARKGGTESNNMYWNGNTVGKVFALIDSYHDVRQYVRDNKFSAYLTISNMGSSTAFVRADADDNDNLSMTIEFDMGRDIEYKSKVVHTFPAKTPPETVAQTMLDKFKEDQAKAHDPEKIIEFLYKYFGFKF